MVKGLFPDVWFVINVTDRIILWGLQIQRHSSHKCHSKILGQFWTDCNVTNVTRLTLWKKDYFLKYDLSQTSQQNNPLGPANRVSQRHKCHRKILGHFWTQCNVTNVTRLTLWKNEYSLMYQFVTNITTE